MIYRVFDPAQVNGILNAPNVRASVGGEGLLDSTRLLADRRNICLVAEGGGALFAWRGPRVFEGHSFFTARGSAAIRLGKAMLDAVSQDADMVWGVTPQCNRAARWFNRQIGFTSLGMIDTPEGRGELFEKRFVCP